MKKRSRIYVERRERELGTNKQLEGFLLFLSYKIYLNAFLKVLV